MSVSGAYARGRRRARALRAPAAQAGRERNAIDDGRNRHEFRLLGLMADVPPSEIPLERDSEGRFRTFWNAAINARARDGARERIGGWKEIHTTGQPANTGPRFLHYVPADVAGAVHWLAHTPAGLLATDGGAWYTVNAAWNSQSPRQAYAFNHGPFTILNAAQYADWSLGVPAATATLPDWPETGGVPDWTPRAMCRAGNFFLAAMATEYAVDVSDRVRWSDATDPESLPAKWLPAADNLAGDAVLVGDGPFTAIAAIRDAVCVYRYGETWIGQYVGAPYVWDFRRAFKTRGAVGPNAVAEVAGRHFVVSDQEFGVHDGVNWLSLSSGKAARWLRARHNELSPANGILRYVPEFRELWYLVPGERHNNYGETLLVYGLDSKEFTEIPIPHAAESFDVGAVVETMLPSDWESDAAGWDTDLSTWEPDDISAEGRPVVGSSNLDLDVSERVAPAISMRAFEFATDANGSPQEWRLERRGLDFGDPHAVDTLAEVWPRLVDIQDCWIDVRVGSQMNERDPVAWSAPVRLEPGQRKVDVDTSGRLLAVELSSTCEQLARVEGFDVVYSRGGRS